MTGSTAAVPGAAVLPVPAANTGVVKLAKDIFAGTCGGISVTLVGHPFDTIKVRLQTQPADKPIYNGMIDCAKKTIKWEGFQGLYKGVASPLVGQMFFRASLFGAFGESKRWLGTNADGSQRPLQRLDFYKAGMMTGFVAAWTEGPIDFYKSQMQVQIVRSKMDPAYVSPYKNMADCVKQTIAANGFRGPFQGLGPTLLRNTPANGVYLGSFELMKQGLAERYNCKTTDLSGGVVMACGGLGGILYWLTIFPVDQVKSAMQTDSIHKGQRKFPSMATTVRLLWADGGLKRFYKGFTPCIIRAAPANGAMLFTVNMVLNALNPQA